MYQKALLLFSILACSLSSFSQADTIPDQLVSLGIYADIYYSFDFAQPFNHERPDFIYSYHRTSELNLNLGLIELKYEESRIKSTLGLMTGTFANRNMAHEPNLLRMIHEANIGFKLLPKRELWITAGVMESHIGFESSRNINHWNLTRSILAENTPYYSSGVQLSHLSANEAWYAAILILNGYQRITAINGNSLPAFGHQIQWKPSDNITLNSSSFVGSEFPDNQRRMRYLHNFYAQATYKKWGIIVGMDIAFQQEQIHSNNYHLFTSSIVEGMYHLNAKWQIGARFEHFADDHSFIANVAPGDYWGFASTLTYNHLERLFFRLEARSLLHKDRVFYVNENPSNINFLLSASLVFELNKIL